MTSAGLALLERSRRALVEIDGAIAEARRSARADDGVLSVGHGPFSRAVATSISDALHAEVPELSVRLDEEVTPDSLRRVGAHELAAAVVMESPAAARRHGVRVDTLKDEPLLAVLPASEEEAASAYERYAVPETGQIFYEAGFANFHLHPPTEVHFKNQDRAPLLIVGVTDDKTVPASVSKAQFNATSARRRRPTTSRPHPGGRRQRRSDSGALGLAGGG